MKLYLYGVVKATENESFGPVGFSTEGVPSEIKLMAFQGLGVIHSEKEMEDDEIPATRKNLMNHQKAIELVMEKYTMLPFSFGTVVDDLSEIETLIKERSADFLTSLENIDGKIELSLKATWEKMDIIFEDILANNVAIKQKKEFLLQKDIQDQGEKIELGKMVEEALAQKKDEMAKVVIDSLAPIALDHKVQKNITESMFANLAFFVNKSDEEQFDMAVNELSERLDDNIKFKYVGPLAPFNFL